MTTIKHHLRREFLSARTALDSSYATDATAQAAAHLLAHIPAAPRTIAGYSAIKGEIDLASAYAALAQRGHTLCLPVIQDQTGPLVFRRWQPGDMLEKGQHGTAIPPASAPLVVPDIVIVPLVAFDHAGNRLGYGAGYYDRTLHLLRTSRNPVQVIGAAYSIQQAPTLPSEIYDEKLDEAVTEKGIVRFL